MSQLGEAISVSEQAIDDDETKCPFEHKKPGDVKNALTNDSDKLATRLANGWSTQLWVDSNGSTKAKSNQELAAKLPNDCLPSSVMVDNKKYPYTSSAHHLIPGKASLTKSSLIEFINSSKYITGDIGYDVNGAENGTWLPTHTPLSEGMKDGSIILPDEATAIGYKKLTKKVRAENQDNGTVATFQERYAERVMAETKRQFHDGHDDYSAFVVKVLNKVQLNLLTLSSMCADCCRSNGKNLPPPHQLVFRLNNISSRLKGFLKGPPHTWRMPLYTSRFARIVAESERKFIQLQLSRRI